MKRSMKMLFAVVFALLMALTPLTGTLAEGNWYGLSNSDEVLTIRLSGTWNCSILGNSVDLLTNETAGGTWVGSFLSTGTAGNSIILLEDATGHSANHVVKVFASENGALQVVSAAENGSGLEFMYTTGNVNIRKGPGLNYTSLGVLSKGKKVTLLGMTRKDSRGVKWESVTCDNLTGWVSEKYLSSSAAGTTAKTVVITGETVNLRAKPNLAGKIVTQMHKGDTAAYLNEKKTDDRGVVWYHVRANGDTAWVSSRYSKLGTSGAETSYVYKPVVKGGSVHMRKQPNLNGKVITALSEGTQCTYLEDSSVDGRGVTWYYVSAKGYKGWVSSKFLVW